MKQFSLCFDKVKKDCLKFIKSQETKADKFKNKERMIKSFLIPLCFWINGKTDKKKPYFVGLAGGQGTGKTTSSSLIKIILSNYFKLKVFRISIDDFYKTRKERIRLSRRVHPMLLTRGVPGTHDTKMMLDFFKKVKSKKFKRLKLPTFNKAVDDRFNKKYWYNLKDRPDIVIFEGWCVGATSQNDKNLKKPINNLEKFEDNKFTWRKKVNNELKTRYKKTFNLIDAFIFLQVPSFKYVYKWRLLQEKKLKLKSRGKKIMNNSQIKNFIMYYERITKNMIKIFSKKANIVIKLDKKHRLNKLKFN